LDDVTHKQVGVTKENLAHNFSENLREVESAKRASKLEFMKFSEILREKSAKRASSRPASYE